MSRLTLFDPDVRTILGLKPLAGECACGCGMPLLPVATRVRLKTPRAGYGVGRVAGWATQDHHNVPVYFGDGDHVICARRDLTVMKPT